MARTIKNPDVRRNEIIDVAQGLFLSKGYEQTSVQDILDGAGIAKGTFYLYFDGKEQLLFELVNQLRQKAMEEFLAAVEQETTVAGKLRTMIRMSLDAFHEYPLLARLVSDDPEFRLVSRLLEQPGMQDEVSKNRLFIASILDEGIAKGELRADLDQDTVPFVIGTMKFLHFYTGLLKFHGVDRKQYVDCLVDVVMRGLQA